jgi:hypothetical protein
VTAFHATDIEGGKDFVFRGSMYPKVKFWGKSVEFQPKGVCTVDLPQWNESYTWFVIKDLLSNNEYGSFLTTSEVSNIFEAVAKIYLA